MAKASFHARTDLLVHDPLLLKCWHSHYNCMLGLDKVQKDLPATPPLRYDWTSFAYTDGSHIKQAAGRKNIPKLGAAVYLPPTALHPEGQSIPILPHCADAVANTINRAELIALYTALRHDCTVIATDSLVSIYQLPITRWPCQSRAPVGAAPPTRSQLRRQRHTQVPVQAQTIGCHQPTLNPLLANVCQASPFRLAMR